MTHRRLSQRHQPKEEGRDMSMRNISQMFLMVLGDVCYTIGHSCEKLETVGQKVPRKGSQKILRNRNENEQEKRKTKKRRIQSRKCRHPMVEESMHDSSGSSRSVQCTAADKRFSLRQNKEWRQNNMGNGVSQMVFVRIWIMSGVNRQPR